MPASIIVWDIETVPDLRGFAAANGLIGKLEDELRAEMGDEFPKLIYHSIVCIGALVALRQDEDGKPVRLKLRRVAGFSRRSLAPDCAVVGDGLACFASVTKAGCTHTPHRANAIHTAKAG
jgi:hypothetical protein